MMTFHSKLLIVAGSLLTMQIACSQATKVAPSPKPETYQQSFDKSLSKLNADLATYAIMDCQGPQIKLVSKVLIADLDNFSKLAEDIPADDNFLKNTEISLGVLDIVDLLVKKKETCKESIREINPNNGVS